MIKFIVFALVFSLILTTTLIKNSTKDLNEKIHFTQENILFLENRFKDSKLKVST